MNMPSDLLRALEALAIGILTLLTLSNYPVTKATPEEPAPQVLQVATTTAPSPETKLKSAPQEKIYVLLAAATSSVESLMQAKRSEGKLAYVSREYPTLGSFLESIDGHKNGNGQYWMLYINGNPSSTGMSQTVVIPGDYIEWRYE
ncbi:MAG: DUF4430 domain-containing protein [Candidatus Pacebacteria bacterium]|nr:DUF4430 domain-containing protein [Candidatus Paceibacterota bacterium]